jgi:hypothetical protein
MQERCLVPDLVTNVTVTALPGVFLCYNFLRGADELQPDLAEDCLTC